MNCPSCGGVIRAGYCENCGAEIVGGRWRPGRGKKVDEAKPNKENYIECPTCTKAAGEKVLHHKSTLKTREEMFEDPATLCPLGHVIPAAKAS